MAFCLEKINSKRFKTVNLPKQFTKSDNSWDYAISSDPISANLGLFLFTVIYFLKQRQTLTPRTTINPQPQTLPSIQTTNEWPNQLSPIILQQLQEMITQRQLVNVNHNQLALHSISKTPGLFFLSEGEMS